VDGGILPSCREGSVATAARARIRGNQEGPPIPPAAAAVYSHRLATARFLRSVAMLRSLAAIASLLLLALAVWSAEYKGKVKSVDADKNTITVTIDDKDKTFTVGDDVKFTRGDKEVKKKLKAKLWDKSPAVTILTEGEGDKEVVKEIKVGKKKE
jgi:hypothetical protein